MPTADANHNKEYGAVIVPSPDTDQTPAFLIASDGLSGETQPAKGCVVPG